MTTRLAEDLMGAISVALKAGDMEGAAALIRMLAIEDPKSAEAILEVVHFVFRDPGEDED